MAPSSSTLPSPTPKTKVASREGVLYLGHLPFGFFESQIRTFFRQFGIIKRFCLKRSKKNGNSKGYGFIQFKNKEIADIVANSMDGYLLFGRSLVCTVVDNEKVHSSMFTNGKAIQSRSLRRRIAASRQNRTLTPAALLKRLERRKEKNLKLEKRLEDLGIEYSLEAFGVVTPDKLAINSGAEATRKEKSVESSVLQKQTGNKIEAVTKPKKIELASKPKKIELASKPKNIELASKPNKMEATSKPKNIEATSKPKKIEAALKSKKVEAASKPKKIQAASKPKKIEAASKLKKVVKASKARKSKL